MRTLTAVRVGADVQRQDWRHPSSPCDICGLGVRVRNDRNPTGVHICASCRESHPDLVKKYRDEAAARRARRRAS